MRSSDAQLQEDTAVQQGNAEKETSGLQEPEKNIEKTAPEITEKTREPHKMVHTDYKRHCLALSVVCAILAVSVIAMFIISGTGNNTTILNYENQLIDKYEAWEQELEQREAAVDQYHLR